MAQREEHWVFWGINHAKKACEILLKNHIRFKITRVGDEWLSRKCYLQTEISFTIDDTETWYTDFRNELKKYCN